METYLYLGALVTLIFILRLIFQETSLWDRPSEIPMVYNFVPWIGIPLRYIAIGPRAFILECRLAKN